MRGRGAPSCAWKVAEPLGQPSVAVTATNAESRSEQQSVRLYTMMLSIEYCAPRSTIHHAFAWFPVYVTEPPLNVPSVTPSTAREAVPSNSVLDCMARLPLATFVTVAATTSPPEK